MSQKCMLKKDMESKKGKKVKDVRGTSGQCLQKGNGKWWKEKKMSWNGQK